MHAIKNVVMYKYFTETRDKMDAIKAEEHVNLEIVPLWWNLSSWDTKVDWIHIGDFDIKI